MEKLHPNYGSTKTKEESFAEDTLLNPLPRAVLRPNSYILLDGEWNFAIDTDDKGITESWHLGYDYKHAGNWPGSIEEHIIGAKLNSPAGTWSDKVVAWYEREFPMPQLANGNGNEHSLLQLTFGACGYETMVWLNGVLLRTIEGEAVHYGEYTSFSYELNPQTLKEVNRLSVRIADTMDADIPRGKQESHVYKRGGIWYQT